MTQGQLFTSWLWWWAVHAKAICMGVAENNQLKRIYSLTKTYSVFFFSNLEACLCPGIKKSCT